jgi:hypothetical protein
MEPTSTAAGGFALSKLYLALSSLVTGYMLSFFWRPAKLQSHGRLAAGAIIGGISVGASVIFGGAVSVYLGMDPNDANTALAVGGSIGIMAVGIVSLLANFFDKREEADLLEVVEEVTTRAPRARVPAKKAPAKKTVKKVVTK